MFTNIYIYISDVNVKDWEYKSLSDSESERARREYGSYGKPEYYRKRYLTISLEAPRFLLT